MALNVERIVGTHTTAFVSSPCVLSSRTSVSNGIVKDYRINGNDRYKTMTLDAHEFIRRFLMHVLPSEFHRRQGVYR